MCCWSFCILPHLWIFTGKNGYLFMLIITKSVRALGNSFTQDIFLYQILVDIFSIVVEKNLKASVKTGQNFS